MSGIQSKFVKPNTFEFLLYGASRGDPYLKQGLKAVFEGETSSHSGGKLYFNEDLFNQYIKGTNERIEIPHEIYETKKYGKVYAIDINFGPTSGIASNNSRQNFGVESQLASQALFPNKASNFAITSGLDEPRYLQSAVPILSFFSRHKVNVAPTTIFQLNLIPEDLRTDYTKKLTTFAENIEKIEQKYFNSQDPRAFEKYIEEFYTEIDNLKLVLNPKYKDMTHIEFMQYLDSFSSFGLSPESSTINLTDDQNKTGYNTEKMLQFVRNYYDNSENTPYNLFTDNCSHFINKMFRFSASSNDPQKQKELIKPFEIKGEYKLLGKIANLLPLPGNKNSNGISTPVMLAEQLENAKSTVAQLNAQENNLFKENMPNQSRKRVPSFSYNHDKLSLKKYSPFATIKIKNIDKIDIDDIKKKISSLPTNNDVIEIEKKDNSYIFFINNHETASIIPTINQRELSIHLTGMPIDNDTALALSKAILTSIKDNNSNIEFEINGKDKNYNSNIYLPIPEDLIHHQQNTLKKI